MKLNPIFDDLTNPSTIIDHVEGLTGNKNGILHFEVLEKLKEQISPIDFQELAFPEAKAIKDKLKKLNEKQKKDPENEDIKEEILEQLSELGKLKVNLKHYLVLSIDNLLEVANKNNWGLCLNHDFIYLYNGEFWAEMDKKTFEKFLGETAEKMSVPIFDAKFYQFRDQLFKQFLSTAYLPTPENNENKVLVNLKNGTFEVPATGEIKIKPFDPSDFLLYQLPFEYAPKAKAPLFEAYLNRVLPDNESQRVLCEFLGYIFIKNNGSLKLEKALILFGGGQNGKSVFFEIVNALLGANNVSSFSLQSLTNDNGYFRAKISNKLVNYASEINGKLDTAIFKQLVSGEPVEARLPYGQPFLLKQYAKLIFNLNELPKDVEHTKAYFRRFLIVPFDQTITEEEKDPDLAQKIISSELSGVFNWVLEGLHRIQEQRKFSKCDAVEKAVLDYQIESDSVQMFLLENGYKPSTEKNVKLSELFNEYQRFCSENGYRPCSTKTMISRLENSGYHKHRKNIGMVIYIER
jgi:putative DNA primase/helicase